MVAVARVDFSVLRSRFWKRSAWIEYCGKGLETELFVGVRGV